MFVMQSRLASINVMCKFNHADRMETNGYFLSKMFVTFFAYWDQFNCSYFEKTEKKKLLQAKSELIFVVSEESNADFMHFKQ